MNDLRRLRVLWDGTLGRRLASGSVPPAALTLWLLHRYGLHSEAATSFIPHVLGAALPIISLALVFRPQLAALAARASSRSAAARTASIGYRSTSTFQRWLSQSSRIVVGGAAYPYAASGCDPRVRDAKRIEHGHAELGVAPRLNTSCR